MKNKKKYKFTTGIQRIEMDTPDYSKAYNLQSEEAAKNQGIQNATGMLSGQFKGISDLGNAAGSVIKSRDKSKEGAKLGGAVSMGSSFAALGAKAGPWGALAGAGIGAFVGARRAGKEYEKGKRLQEEAERETMRANNAKLYTIGSTTDAQSALAKKGKYKVKTGTSTFKQPKEIEIEGGKEANGKIRKNGGEVAYGPKKADGTRDMLYHNPKDPTHAAGGVKAVVVPKEMYNNGTNNLMPKRPASKYSLVGNGMMAVGAKQLKVNTLNDTALSSNLIGMPAVNAANKFIQPMAGINQVARNIPEARRRTTIKNPMSQRKENPDTNRIINPPVPNELKPKPEKSRYEKGSKYVKVYAEGSKGVSLAFSRGEKDPKGGLTQKGVDKYNRATGGNLKMAVTTPPSKLKAGSKDANRRKSFCARMSGVDGPMEKNGKPTRKALALRKWNC